MTGSIAFMPLSVLLQTLDMQRCRGRLTVWIRGELHGTVWIDQGSAVDAQCGLASGEDAVYRMLSLQTGHFRVDFGTVDRPRRIQTSTQGLLLEGMRHLDESRRLSA